ncbi:MAG: hypothetical protein HWD85_09570 [Flavobacteriaceae bacterium]|nr:hypothetical protein [Flavobacteriaceae bacterium]
MKQIVFTLLVLLTLSNVVAQKSNPNYNSDLAKKLGADDYGMKKFVFVLLKTGTNKSTDKAFKSKCFASHMKNTDNLIKERKMIVAGPFFKNNNNYRGIFILAVDSVEKAQELLKKDKAITEKFLEAVYYDWYGSAALGEYLNTADKIWKIGF